MTMRGVRGLPRLLAAAAMIAMLLGVSVPAAARPSPAGRNTDWPRWGNTSDQQRFSPLRQINPGTVARLGVAWAMSGGPEAILWEDDPVVVHAVMYVTTNTGQVIAVAADSGRRLWSYTPQVDFLRIFARAGMVSPVSRGVEVADGHVYLLTFDDQLISLDAATGKQQWRTVVADAGTYYEESPPTYWQGLLLVGEVGAGLGISGFVAAFDAHTGTLRWRFSTVPSPGRSWMRAIGRVGGGDVWMPVTVDTTSAIAYLATGNPTPDLVNHDRPGCNPWTDATVALDARTGRLLWGHTLVCNDVWDYDSAQSPLLLTLRRGGKTVRAVGQGSKAGRYWILDARTGATLAVTPPLGTQSTPRPIPVPTGTLVCPGIYGSLEYSPPAYSPRTGLIYLPGLNLCTIDRPLAANAAAKQDPGVVAFGGTTSVKGVHPSGFLAAMDPVSGRLRWQIALSAPLIGGALATAGGMVFSGSDDGYLSAFADDSGTRLWQARIGLGFGAAPISYMVNGVQYLAIVAGGSAVAPVTGAHLGALLVVFRLGGQPPRCLRAKVGSCSGP